MSKWRPTEKDCVYVVPDVHGNVSLLKKICDRILPLRKSDGVKDKLILLGDLIDRHTDSHLVIDFCIELEKKYGSQVAFLMGNHELMLLQALNIQPGKSMTLQGMTSTYKMWMENGGYDTIAGYMKRKGLEESWGSLPRSRVIDIIPKEHIEFFMKSLVKYYEIGDFLFVHGGVNPLEPASTQELEVLVWDRSLAKFVLNAIQFGGPLPWEKTVICGHNVMSSMMPIVKNNYMMLDCGSPKQLLVVELNSRQAYMSYPNKDRLVKFELKETTKVPGIFHRVQ